ncbi:NAD(P)H-dependent oxidoreductase [Sunxiuqinia sp. A32]|uniref:NAD(P)H-dependent oxidoreductase n=1 Tax=Sunxiuqinia sp. A32 TaxID=3461496 RepID=UPI0040464F35
MKALIILAHPDKNSFNHAIADTCRKTLLKNGHSVIFHDLYAEKFNAIINHEEFPKDAPIDKSVEEHCQDLATCDGIIVIHPNWWGQPPAIMKGWIDRIIRPGVAYEFEEGDSGEGVPIGLLKANTGIVFNTSNTSEERENKLFKDPLETIWKNCIFDFCGVKDFVRRMFRTIITSDLQQRQTWLSEVEQIIETKFGESTAQAKIEADKSLIQE